MSIYTESWYKETFPETSLDRLWEKFRREPTPELALEITKITERMGKKKDEAFERMSILQPLAYLNFSSVFRGERRYNSYLWLAMERVDPKESFDWAQGFQDIERDIFLPRVVTTTGAYGYLPNGAVSGFYRGQITRDLDIIITYGTTEPDIPNLYTLAQLLKKHNAYLTAMRPGTYYMATGQDVSLPGYSHIFEEVTYEIGLQRAMVPGPYNAGNFDKEVYALLRRWMDYL